MKNSKKYTVLALFILFIITIHSVYPQGSNTPDHIYIDKNFYSEFQKASPIIRDTLFEMKLNGIVHSRGVVKSIDKEKRYRKNFRMILYDVDAEKMDMKFTYYIFFDNQEYLTMVSKDMTIQFTGQLMSYTPINTKRDSYILDIVLEKGSIVFD